MWHLSHFSKRLELLIKPSNYGYNAYNQPVLVGIPDQIIPYLIESYYISFVDIEGNSLCFFPKKFSPSTNEVDYYVNVSSIDDVNYTCLFVYYDISDRGNLDICGVNNGLEVYEYKSYSNHPSNHEEVLAKYKLTALIYNSYTVTDVYISKGYHYDFFCFFVTGWFYVENTVSGTWGFALDSDDAAEVEVDGSVIVGWYGGHPVCNCYDHNVEIYLEEGWHKFVARHNEQTGHAHLRVYAKPQGETTWFQMGTTAAPCISFSYTEPYIYTSDFIDNFDYGILYTQIANVFEDAYIVNFLDTTSLVSKVGENFSNHAAALHQPICDTYAVKMIGGTTYISCDISKISFTLFFNCCLVVGEGYLIYFSSNDYVYVNADGSLVVRSAGTNHNVGSKLYFNVCSTFSITYDGSNIYVVINGLTKLVIAGTINISTICFGGSGTSGSSIECYFFDLFLLPPKLPLYSYYLHNTRYDDSNFFRESGYDTSIINGYLTCWPEVLFAGDEVIFKFNSTPSGVIDSTKCSVSFNNGSSWYVSNLNYDDIFTKYFGSPHEYDTVLRLSTDIETIDKHYITKVNDFNQFDVNYDVDFTAGEVENGYIDTETDFIVALPVLYGVKPTPVEYAYETSMSGLKSLYFSRPVEISWGGALSSGIISKDVEYCFDTIVDSWADDTEVDFGLGELYQGYYIDYFVDLTLSSGYISCTDVEIDFVLANWRYFPHQADIICSIIDYSDQETEIEIGKGRLMRFLSDIKASNMVYDDFNSSVFCSLSGVFPDCFSEVQIISGSIGNYDSDIYCSLVDFGNFGAEIKLNTVVIENFNINETVITGTNFCFNIDVYDKYYGVTTSGIQIYMNTNTITGNEVINKTFLTISGGYTTSWCYDVGSLSPAEYIEVIIKGTNIYGDLNIASYFLRYGKRYHYNLYHITKHEYETLIPILMAAENNVDIFPSFSTETMYVRTENYRRANLSASIFGVSLDRDDLQAEVMVLTNNFYNGGYYKVRVECSDLSGNEMNPLEFEFTIRSDGL